MQENILYTNTDITTNICIYKETDFLYSIMYEQVPNKIILFTSYGKYLGEFSKLSTENSGMLAAKKNGNCGYIDSHGNEVIPFVYTFAHSFNDNGYAIVGDKDSKMSVIDKYGHMLFKPILVNSMNFLTLELLKIEKQKVGVIDLKGKEIIPCIYDEVWQCSSYIRVMRNNKHGLFNMKGECLLDCVYSEIIETTDKFVVRDNNKNVVPQVIIKR
jgi:hypothetical protein